MPEGNKLTSWKEIAAHLGREVRTVQRWEKVEGLPVRRLEHQKQGSVYAFTNELDAWVAARQPAATLPPQPPRRAPWQPIVAAAALLVVGVGLWWWLDSRTLPLSQSPTVAAMPVAGRFFAAATTEGAHRTLLSARSNTPRTVLAAGGRQLYATDDAAHGILIFDALSLEPLGAIRLPFVADTLVATRDGSRVLAASTAANGIVVIDTTTRKTTWVSVGSGVADLAVMPDGKTVYVAQLYEGLSRLDLSTFAVAHLATVACPAALAAAPDGQRVFVAYQCGGPGGHAGRDTIGIFDTVRQRFVAEIGGGMPMVGTALAISPDGAELWASSGDACSSRAYDHRGCPSDGNAPVYVFSTGTGRLLRRLEVTPHTPAIRFLAGGAQALLGGTIMDATRGEAIEAVPSLAVGTATAVNGRRLFLSTGTGVEVFDAPAGNCSPPRSGLVAWWPGDGTPADGLGMLQGHIEGRVGYAPGRLGQGFQFTGQGAVNVGHDIGLARAWKDGLTVGVWVKPVVAGGVLMQKMASNGATGWRFELSAGGQLQACFAGAAHCMLGAPHLQPGVWHYVALVGSTDGQARIWLDGEVIAQGPVPNSGFAPGADLIAGIGYHGLLDEMVVYNRTLHAAGLRTLLALPQCLAPSR